MPCIIVSFSASSEVLILFTGKNHMLFSVVDVLFMNEAIFITFIC
jgi:hypothetical protein